MQTVVIKHQRNTITWFHKIVRTQKAVLKELNYLATLTILGLYCLRSCNRVFIVFPVSIISLIHSMREACISVIGIESRLLYYKEKSSVHTSTINTFCGKRKQQLSFREKTAVCISVAISLHSCIKLICVFKSYSQPHDHISLKNSSENVPKSLHVRFGFSQVQHNHRHH